MAVRWIERVFRLGREVAALGLGVYAANGAYFLVLALVPAVGLVEMLPQVLAEPVGRLLGEVFPPGLEALTGVTGRSPALGIVAVWSASKGLYGLLRGLRVIYGTSGGRGWFLGRLVCLVYALGAMVAGLALLPLAEWMTSGTAVTALAVLTAAFTGLYLTACRRRTGASGAAVGAAGASCVCLVLSRLYGKLLGRGALYGVAGGLLLVYLWAWTVLLGAVFHAKVLRN